MQQENATLKIRMPRKKNGIKVTLLKNSTIREKMKKWKEEWSKKIDEFYKYKQSQRARKTSEVFYFRTIDHNQEAD